MEEMNNIMVLNDETGKEVSFQILDSIRDESGEYVVLLPVDDFDDEEVVILKVCKDDDGNECYASVVDEIVLDKVFATFKDKFKDEFLFLDVDDIDTDISDDYQMSGVCYTSDTEYRGLCVFTDEKGNKLESYADEIVEYDGYKYILPTNHMNTDEMISGVEVYRIGKKNGEDVCTIVTDEDIIIAVIGRYMETECEDGMYLLDVPVDKFLETPEGRRILDDDSCVEDFFKAAQKFDQENND